MRALRKSALNPEKTGSANKTCYDQVITSICRQFGSENPVAVNSEKAENH